MSTESILKDYHIKDEEAFMRLVAVLEDDAIEDDEPELEECPLARGQRLLDTLSFL